MNNFVIDTPDNFWQIRWLDKYMEGHKGFIAGGCFKNILSGERVKDIDIFFESESDFQEAIDSFNDEKHQKEGWKFKYRNEKACAFQKDGKRLWIYSASGTLHVMMHGDTNYNPTPEFTQYGGSNIENSVTIIDGILNDGGDW